MLRVAKILASRVAAKSFFFFRLFFFFGKKLVTIMLEKRRKKEKKRSSQQLLFKVGLFTGGNIHTSSWCGKRGLQGN